MDKKEKLLELINVVLSNRGKTNVASISREQNLRSDIGLDSMDLAELTVRIEMEFDVDVFADGLITTVGEILDKI
jgi:acyl carrier protein